MIIYCIIIIFLLYNKIKFESFTNKCQFIAKGKIKDKCISECGKECKDNIDECLSICSSCKDYKKCEWLEPPTCKYEPSGNKPFDCIDECIGPRKIQWGGDACQYNECKRICESCKNENKCNWLSKLKVEKKCDFVPWGPNKQACIDRCSSSDKDTWGGDSCDNNSCSNICNSCDKEEYCEWLKSEPPFLEPKEMGIPPQQELRLIPGNSKILIQWNPKHNIDHNLGYFIYYFKSSMPMEGIKVKKIIKNDCTFCEYLLENLENDNNYSITIIAYNKLGKGAHSKVMEAKPSQKINLIYSEQ